jgi:predicted nucleic acid-binding protein
VQLVEALRADPACTIVPPSVALFDAGVSLYGERSDTDWTLTDCISFVVMHEYGITEALTGDRHFQQAGFTPLLF